MIKVAASALALLMMTAMFAGAQEATKPPAAPRVQIPLKITLVLSRHQGEKKIASVPYSLYVTTNEGRTSLRMSVQMPVPQNIYGMTTSGEKAGMSATVNYTLKDVGTNIDCMAEPAIEPGVYKVYLVVTDTTALPMSMAGKSGEGQQMPSLPPITIRNFTSTFNILLRDGQTAQYTSATDPVNGEVLKLDATLNVLK